MLDMSAGLLGRLLAGCWSLLTPAVLLVLALLVPVLVLVRRSLSEDQQRISKLPGPKPVYPVLGHVMLMPRHVTGE